MIEGKLINLRALDLRDAPAAHGWFNDTEVTRYLSWRYTISLRAEEQFLERTVSYPMSYTNTNFGVETKDGTLIGSTSLHRPHDENRSAHFGITLGEKAYWSRGYGQDTTLTVCRFGFEEMNLNRIDLTVDADHERAIAAYTRCGFREEGRLRDARYRRGRYIDWIIMSILRDEFRGT
jgi:RimJ/RimL family protein N-acetyltransferase